MPTVGWPTALPAFFAGTAVAAEPPFREYAHALDAAPGAYSARNTPP